MSYKIIIIDNETNETIVNENNAKAIIGAIAGEKQVSGVGILECEGDEALNALEMLGKVKEGLFEKHPKLALASLLKEMKHLCDLDPTKKD
jgi:hypothetical protein